MRICYLCPDLGIPIDGHKGASAHVRGLIKAFREEGHELRVITGAMYENNSNGVPVMSVAGPAITQSPFLYTNKRMGRALRHLWTNVARENVLEELIEDFMPDLIY